VTSTSEASPADITLPASSSTMPASAGALVVVLSPTRLALDRDGAALAVPPTDHATWPLGFEAQFKRQSRNDLFLKTLGDAMEARFAADAAVLNVVVMVDAAIAYRLLVETIYTLGQERASEVSIAVSSGARVCTIALTLPRRDDPEMMMEREAARRAVLAALATDGGARPSAPAAVPSPVPSPSASSVPDGHLFLNVLIESGGFVVSGTGRRMSPGCREAGNGVAVPTRDGAYDFAGLTACAATLKGSAPAYATETKVTLSAAASTDVQTVVSAIDALRGGAEPLFPLVSLGVPRG
jgi:biopolymer transport protein ExbD